MRVDQTDFMARVGEFARPALGIVLMIEKNPSAKMYECFSGISLPSHIINLGQNIIIDILSYNTSELSDPNYFDQSLL